jgi:hypothetical protein
LFVPNPPYGSYCKSRAVATVISMGGAAGERNAFEDEGRVVRGCMAATGPDVLRIVAAVLQRFGFSKSARMEPDALMDVGFGSRGICQMPTLNRDRRKAPAIASALPDDAANASRASLLAAKLVAECLRDAGIQCAIISCHDEPDRSCH